MANPLEAGIIGPSQAEAATVNALKGPIRKSRIIARAAAGLSIPISVILAGCTPQTAEVRTVSTPEPGHTPIAIGISLPAACQNNQDAAKGWDIATSKRPLTSADNPFIDAFNACAALAKSQAEARMTAEVAKPTATIEPTKAPPPPTVIPPTPTKEATPIPKPENPLPSYGVFFGEVKDPKTGKKVAEMVMASIPQKEGLDEIFIYSITSPSVAGTRTHIVGQLKPSKAEGTYFELGGKDSRGGATPPWEKATFDKETETITGELNSIMRVTISNNESTFTLIYIGEGPETIFDGMKRVIKNQSSDQPTTPEKELEMLNRPTNWP